MQVEFDRFSLLIDGKRRLIRSGSLHYFRLPSQELWRDRIEKIREAGLNAVDVYYPWNYHSEFRGEYDFSGLRDLDVLHDMIEDAGLYLIARPGPYICAEIDMGGLPAWLLRDRSTLLRCRGESGFAHSPDFVEATREWFGRVIPTFCDRRCLILVQIENEYTVPAPLSGLPDDLVDLLIRWFGMRTLLPLVRSRWLGAWLDPARSGTAAGDRGRGQVSPYMRDLYHMTRDLGVRVPIFHNDLYPWSGRQMDVDLLALDRYPITDFGRDWRDERGTFDAFAGDAEALAAHRAENPLFYPELQAGWYDGWGGVGYERIRELLGVEGIDNAAKAALAGGATLWNYYVFCGGMSWGYMGSPDVYSSYDFGAPVRESGRVGSSYQSVRGLNEFLERFESDLCETVPLDGESWCPEHVQTRQGSRRRFVFLRNPTRASVKIPAPEVERAEIVPWETQIRVYDETGALEAVSPEKPLLVPPVLGQPLPRLESWTFSGASPQLDATFDDSDWTEIPEELVEHGLIDIDALGVHYGFIWYRGTFHDPIDRLLLDARHCYAVWLNRRGIAAGDQFQNTLGVGPDGAKLRRIPLGRSEMPGGRNVLTILVESLGHNKGFAADSANRRGIVRLDTGGARIQWRYREGLIRGEHGLTPVVAFDGVSRTGSRQVALPHGWSGEPEGVGLYETNFRLEGIDAKSTAIAAALGPGRGKANLYLNGVLIGRYWPERGPQRKFILPWGVLHPDRENHLALAVWKRTERAALGEIRLECV
jgi:hypothetical protein